MTKLGLTTEIVDEPINMLCFIPEKTSNDGTDLIPAQWYGICKNSNRKIALKESYVEVEFPATLVSEVWTWRTLGDTKFISIPPGDANPQSKFPEHITKGPNIHFKQGENQNTCLVFSFVSALYNIGGGARQAASKIVQKGDKIINRCNTI